MMFVIERQLATAFGRTLRTIRVLWHTIFYKALIARSVKIMGSRISWIISADTNIREGNEMFSRGFSSTVLQLFLQVTNIYPIDVKFILNF